ncbi:MAG TPA: hypothetical protein VGJ26_21565 [Pirellulales bacterium]|jgi:hypothetical protein
MQFQAGQAIILGVAAMTLCGCSSGIHWPWSKTAEVRPAATDPSVAAAAPTAGANLSPQVAQNTQPTSAQNDPRSIGNNYTTQPIGYAGDYSEARPVTPTAYPPAGAPVGYNTSSTYNAPAAGGVYQAPVNQSTTGSTINPKDGPFSATGAYDTPSNTAAPYGASAQAYGGGAPYGSSPAPSAAYPPANAPYGAGPSTPANAAAGGTVAPYGSTPRMSAAYPPPTAPYGAAVPASDNRYSATRYDTTNTGTSVASTASADPKRPATAPPIDNRYASADPFAGYQNPAPPSNIPAAPPALQTATYGSQSYRPGSTGDVATSPAPGNNDPGVIDVHPATFGALAEGATSAGSSPTASTAIIATGTSDAGVKTWKPTRVSENKSRFSQRVATRQDPPKEQTVVSRQGAPTTAPLNVLPAQSRYKNPLREPESDDLR